MTINQLYSLTPREVNNIIKGRAAVEEERFLERWEMHRIEVITMMGPYLKKGDRNKPYKEIYRLPWEESDDLYKNNSRPNHDKKYNQDSDPLDFWNKMDKKF